MLKRAILERYPARIFDGYRARRTRDPCEIIEPRMIRRAFRRELLRGEHGHGSLQWNVTLLRWPQPRGVRERDPLELNILHRMAERALNFYDRFKDRRKHTGARQIFASARPIIY